MIRLAALLALLLALPAHALETQRGPVTVPRMIAGLTQPWALGFLPEGGVLVTERGGRLLLQRDGETVEVTGMPQVATVGQGGLLDVLEPRDFAQSRTLFLTQTEPPRVSERVKISKDDPYGIEEANPEVHGRVPRARRSAVSRAASRLHQRQRGLPCDRVEAWLFP